MLIRVCKAKIHRATVTEADLNYVGSITIDELLLEKSGIQPFQMLNITNQTFCICCPACNKCHPKIIFSQHFIVRFLCNCFEENKLFEKAVFINEEIIRLCAATSQ